ncbi:glyoxylate reductase [Diplodia corticola]|uniref:Glyoxylate reductase n=1 Tax=Diplodia corticola TaxID=236234 RepID=A0A1J9QSB6_9PEZI|nr:glyoxylate reductase [Diplodia corticola]OJD31862.1 glyoxylate reductase [Diplodia corticola]
MASSDPPTSDEEPSSTSWPTPLNPKPDILVIHSHTRTPVEPILPASTWARLHHLFTIHTLPPTITTIPAFLSHLSHNFSSNEKNNSSSSDANTNPAKPALRAILRTGWLKAGPHADLRLFGTDAAARLPASVEFVTCSGHGHDAADVSALAARGVAYANTPDTCTEAVANAGLHLVLGAFRYFSFAEKCARGEEGKGRGRRRRRMRGCGSGGGGEGEEDDDDDDDEDEDEHALTWYDSRQLGAKAEDPCGKVLGVVGMGDIGTRIAVKCAAALGMRVAYHNRRRNAAAEGKLAALGCEAVYHDTFESLLREADCLCLACPLTDETRGLLGKETLRLVKKSGVRVVNIARGGLIDEDALIEAMEDGRVLGVGLDVHANEPGVNPKLRDNWMTTLLPHIGVCSNTTWREFDRVTFENLENWFYGDRSKVPIVNF